MNTDFRDGLAGPEKQFCVVRRFQEMIEAKPRAGLPIGHYAAVLGVSESRLTAHCRRQTGRSPLQLISACLVRVAKHRMISTSCSTSEIAFSLGFRDPAYFSRFFRLQTGQTPTEFRAAAGGANRHPPAPLVATAYAGRR